MPVTFTFDVAGPSGGRPSSQSATTEATDTGVDGEAYAAEIRELRCPAHGEPAASVLVSGPSGRGHVIRVDGCCVELYLTMKAWKMGQRAGRSMKRARRPVPPQAPCLVRAP